MEATAAKSTFQKYPTYKDSGVDWLGEIPEHWDVKKLKHVFHEKKKSSNPDLRCGSISFGKVIYKDDEKIPESTKASYQELLAGEYLVNPLNLNYDLISLRIGLSDINVVVSPGYIIIKARAEIDKKYFNYLLHRYDVAYMKLLGSGVRQTISFNHISDSLLAFPPLPEQTSIAEFLDRKTEQIDRAIAQKEKMIALLKERKQIVIQELVTGKKVWNEQQNTWTAPAKVKDSGVEWIGEIPEGWEVVKMKHLCHFILDGTHGSYPRVENGYRLLSVRNIIDGKFVFRDDDSMVSTRHFQEISSKFEIQEGDIQLAIVGATMGKVAIVENLSERIVTQRSLSTLRVNKDKCLVKYLAYYIQSSLFQAFLWNNSGFSAQPGIYLGTIQNAHIPLPSYESQTAIVLHIETQSAKIDKAIRLQEQQIEKLKELKASLIDAAVTGKINVVS